MSAGGHRSNLGTLLGEGGGAPFSIVLLPAELELEASSLLEVGEPL